MDLRRASWKKVILKNKPIFAHKDSSAEEDDDKTEENQQRYEMKCAQRLTICNLFSGLLQKQRLLDETYWEDKLFQWDQYVNFPHLPNALDLPSVNSFVSSCTDELYSLSADQIGAKIEELLKLTISMEEKLSFLEKGQKDYQLITEGKHAVQQMIEKAVLFQTFLSVQQVSEADEEPVSTTVFESQNYKCYLLGNLPRSDNSKKDLDAGPVSVCLFSSSLSPGTCLRVLQTTEDMFATKLSSFGIHTEINSHKPSEVFEQMSVIQKSQNSKVTDDKMKANENLPNAETRKQKHSTALDLILPPPKKSLKKQKKSLTRASQPKKRNDQAGDLLESITKRLSIANVEQSKEAAIKADLLSQVTSIWKPSQVPGKRQMAQQSLASSIDIDLRFCNRIFDIFSFDTYPLPSKPKRCGGSWMIMEDRHPDSFACLPYPPPDDFLEVAIRLPLEEVFLSEEPTVAVWDSKSETWKRSVYSTHVEFEKEAGLIKFRLSKLGPVAFFQKTSSFLPFHEWNVHATKHGSLMLIVKTEPLDLSFEIKNQSIKLLVPPNDGHYYKLKSICGRSVSVFMMAKMLLDRGVYIFPNEESFSKSEIPFFKEKSLELQVYQNMAWCSGVMNFSSSHWNTNAGRDVVLLRGSLVESDPALAHCLYRAKKNSYRKLLMNEDSSTFDGAAASDSFLSLANVVEQEASLPVSAIFQKSPPDQMGTIYHWLCALRVLSFSR